MLVGVFKSNQNLVNIIGFVILALLFIPAFYVNAHPHFPEYSLINYWGVDSKFWNLFFSFILIFLEAIYLNFIVNKFKIIENNTHLTSFIYILLNGGIYFILNLNPILIVNGLLLLFLHTIFLIYNLNKSYGFIFNAGVLIGLSTLFFLPSFAFMALLFLAIIYLKTPIWREFVIAFLGLVTPFIYYFYFGYYHHHTLQNIINSYYLPIYNINLFSGLNIKYITLYFVLFIAFFAALKFINCMNNKVVKTKKLMVLFLIFILIASISVLFFVKDDIVIYILLTTPFAVMIASFLYEIKRKWLSELIVILWIATIICSYFS